MNSPFYQLILFPSSDTKNGILTMFQRGQSEGSKVPFDIKKVLVTKGMSGKDIRGGHTHHKTQQLLICISGGCTVNLDNGKEQARVRLDKPTEGLLLYPYVWHTMQDFADNTILLILADTEYDEKEYIRDYNEFMKNVTEKNLW